MKRREFVLTVLAPTVITAIAGISSSGCGGASGRSGQASSSGGGRGQFTLTFRWPEQTPAAAAANSRLIPAFTQVIVATLTAADGTVLGTRNIPGNDGPPSVSTETFTNLPAGAVTLTATAYPNADGTGVALATGSVGATIQSGQTTRVTLTMGSTIASIEVTPANPTIGVGERVRLAATPRDAAGNVVLVTSSNFSWVSGNTAAATSALENGQATEAVGAAIGAALFTVTEKDSGKSGSTTVTVAAVVANGCVPGPVTGPGGLLATSAWPKAGSDTRNTGRGKGSGATGILKWSITTAAAHGYQVTIGADGTLFLGTDSGVSAYDAATGALKWANTAVTVNGSTPAVGADGGLYFAGSDAIFSLDQQTGVLRWSNSQSLNQNSATIGADGTIYLCGVSGSGLRAYDPTNGATKWSALGGKSFAGWYWTTLGMSADGTLYVGDGTNLYAVDGKCGSIRWTTSVGRVGGTAIGDDGTVFATVGVGNTSAKPNAVVAFDPNSGAVKWTASDVPGELTPPAIGYDGTVYVLGPLGELTALSPDTGAKKWTYTAPLQVSLGSPLPGSNRASPVVGSDGTIYYAQAEFFGGRLFAINPNGTQKWEYLLEGSAQDATPTIAADGTIYIRTWQDKKLYAIGSENPASDQ